MEPQSLFSLLVLSLSKAALESLGLIPADRQRDLESVQHNIDLLVMLQQKTKNNLDDEESALLESILYDLRIKFLEASDNG